MCERERLNGRAFSAMKGEKSRLTRARERDNAV